jgi:peptidoglycan/LPS O-acetylase OafA/YrhL
MNKKIESVQMMRGIAALSVVVCHLGIIGNTGGFGVDLFFCISGFIMMFVTEKSYAGFLKKRFLRICPLYYLLTIGAFAMAFIAPQLLRSPNNELDMLLRSLLFICGDNAETESTIVVGVGWTLCYEMLFYLLFFAAFTISHKNRHYIATAFLVIIVLTGVIVKPENQYFAFYTSPILLEFALGMFAYKILYRRNQHNIMQHNTVRYSLLLLAILIYASLFVWGTKADRLFTAGIPTFVFFLLIFRALQDKKIAKFLIVLGNISYSLYLTHTFVITAFARLIMPTDKLNFSSIVASVIATGLTIGVAYVSWYLIENKLTNRIKIKLEKST